MAEKNAEVRRAHLGGLLELGAALRCGAKGAAACLALLAEPAVAMLRPYLKKAPAGAASRADAVSLLCVLAEASAAGVDKAKAACTADKVWALTLTLTRTLTLALTLTLTLTLPLPLPLTRTPS